MTLLKSAYRNQVVPQLAPVAVQRKVLTTEQLRPLQQLTLEHVKPKSHVRGHQQRMGTNNTDNLSRYRTLKEYYWPPGAVEALEPLAHVTSREATHWLLHFDKGDFLDEQDAWVDRRTPVDFYLVALFAKQHLVIDGQNYVLGAGDAIQFAPSYRHAVPPMNRESAWLCFMVFRNNQKDGTE